MVDKSGCVMCAEFTIKQREKVSVLVTECQVVSLGAPDVFQPRLPSLSCQRNSFSILRDEVTRRWCSCAGGIVNPQAGFALLFSSTVSPLSRLELSIFNL